MHTIDHMQMDIYFQKFTEINSSNYFIEIEIS